MIAITFDLDWAPDYVIDAVAEDCLRHGVRATWFVTHRSPAVERLRARPEAFELGIHPNFLPGSTHGPTPEAVLSHCLELVPEALSLRTHALVQSAPLYDLILARTPLEIDASLFLPYAAHAPIVPYWRDGTRVMARIPFVWSDIAEMERDRPDWRLTPLARGGGARVFAFHPVHLFLNSGSKAAYLQFKAQVPDQRQAPRAALEACRQSGPGAGSAFLELLELAETDGPFFRLRDLYDVWREEATPPVPPMV